MPKQNDLGNVVGRHPLIDIENISVLNQSSPTKRANAKGIDQSKAAIKAQQTAEFEERGLSTRTVRSPSKTSLRNYHTLAATEPGVSLTKSTIHKTEKRFAAETSLRSTAAYLATVIANHFVPCEDAESEIPKDIGPGAKELHSIVNKFFKVPMCALKPQYVTSTDNTAVFAIEGIIKDGQNEWKRVSSSAAKHSERASRSIFTTEETKDSFICNGLRIKLTFTFSAAGTMAPLVMRIARLSESELPVSTCPDGFLVVAVPGLCVGGSVDPRANSTGYIVFTRKSSASSVSI